MIKPPVKFRKNEPLSKHLSMKTGGRVKYFFEPENSGELATLVGYLFNNGISYFLLGGGTNVVAPGKIATPAVVSTKKIRGLMIEGGRITVACGEPLPRLAVRTARAGFSGLQGLAGIPGTVGGAVAMNAGGKWGCIGDAVSAVTALDVSGVENRYERKELEFTYRHGPFGDKIITSVEFDLNFAGKTVLDEFKAHLREKSAAQPLDYPSAGCVYLNPPGESAGALIDRAGLKGLAIGGAKVSEKHANFIITNGEARPSDVMRLMRLVETEVLGKFGIALKPEVKIVA